VIDHSQQSHRLVIDHSPHALEDGRQGVAGRGDEVGLAVGPLAQIGHAHAQAHHRLHLRRITVFKEGIPPGHMTSIAGAAIDVLRLAARAP
jgi:hypothetical protein